MWVSWLEYTYKNIKLTQWNMFGSVVKDISARTRLTDWESHRLDVFVVDGERDGVYNGLEDGASLG